MHGSGTGQGREEGGGRRRKRRREEEEEGIETRVRDVRERISTSITYTHSPLPKHQTQEVEDVASLQFEGIIVNLGFGKAIINVWGAITLLNLVGNALKSRNEDNK